MAGGAQSLDSVLADRLHVLSKLGRVIDSQLQTWVSAANGSEDDTLNALLADARRLIEQTVDMAIASQANANPDVQSMRQEWENRFKRISQLIERREENLMREAKDHLHQNQAAQSYTKVGQL